MIAGKKIVVVLPAYNAERTLEKTFRAIPPGAADLVLLTDDDSTDKTVELAKSLGIQTFRHDKNRGYGANQKTCYREALAAGADVVAMLHPDYQYNPKLLPAMTSLVAEGIYDAVVASRILGGGALRGGMPFYKYVSNRILTGIENMMSGAKLSEYHTGYRVFSRQVIETLPLMENSDDFVFDNQMLMQVLAFGFNIGEISCPTVYAEESSSISFSRSVRYGFGVLGTGAQYLRHRMGLGTARIFRKDGERLNPALSGAHG